MSNQNEIDYEKQFNEDLAKATALSLEQQALDEYNRTKKYGSYYDTARKSSSAVSVKEEYAAQQQGVAYARSTSFNSGERSVYSLVNKTTATTNAAPTSADTAVENDLINFNSPTAQKPNEQQTFEKLINDLQKFQTTTTPHVQTALVPMPTPQAPPNYMHAAAQAAAAAGAGGLQLVPFMATQKMPLTNENLKQLYNMPYGPPSQAIVPRPAAPAPYPMGFVAPSAAYMPPQNARYPYQYATTIPYSNSYAAAITPPTASVNAPAPTFSLPLHAKSGSASSTTDGRVLNRHSSVSGDSSHSNILRRHSRTAAGDDLIDLNQLDEYVP